MSQLPPLLSQKQGFFPARKQPVIDIFSGYGIMNDEGIGYNPRNFFKKL